MMRKRRETGRRRKKGMGRDAKTRDCKINETGRGYSFLHLSARGSFGQNVPSACFLPIQKTPIARDVLIGQSELKKKKKKPKRASP